MLSACGASSLPSAAHVQNAPTETSALIGGEQPSVTAVPPLEYSWGSVLPTQVYPLGEQQTQLALSTGYAFAIAPKAEVYPNDKASATFTVSGPAGRNVTAILQRHCNPELGDDATFHSFVLTGQPQTESLSHLFTKQYGCFRLSLLSSDKLPLSLVVSVLELTLLPSSGESPFSPDSNLVLSEVESNRASFGKVIFYFGDSISRGAVLRKFPDEFTEPEARFERNWNQRSPSAVSNLVRTETGVAAVFAGPTGQPHIGNVELIEKMVKAQTIRPGDIVVLEDAGQHNKSPQSYMSNWLALRTALSKADVLIIMATTPEFVAPSANSESMQYDLPFEGMTHNEATRLAANADIDGASRTRLLDLDQLLDDPKYFRSDSVHFNLIGQCVFVQNVHLLAGLVQPTCSTLTTSFSQ